MATLQASKVLEALARAKQVGRVETSVTIDGCPLVLQNLTTSDYNNIHAETEGLDEVAYLHGFQEGHICRSIVEIGDQDLRDVQFIEEEVPSGAYVVEVQLPNKSSAEALATEARKKGGKASVIPPSGDIRTIRLERHAWIKDHFMPEWGREAVIVAWQKFSEVLDEAENKAREGITFKVPDETSEEKLRRLFSELKEVEEELPPEIAEAVYNEMGLFKASSKQEMDRVNTKLRDLKPAPEVSSATPKALEPAPAPQVPEQAPEPLQRTPSSEPTPEELMQTRMPLNRRPVANPRPPSQETTTSAAKRVLVPEQIQKAAVANTASMRGRSAQIASLEAQVTPDVLEHGTYDPHGGEIAELSAPLRGIDGAEARTIINTPPKVGINTRFKPPQR